MPERGGCHTCSSCITQSKWHSPNYFSLQVTPGWCLSPLQALATNDLLIPCWQGGDLCSVMGLCPPPQCLVRAPGTERCSRGRAARAGTESCGSPALISVSTGGCCWTHRSPQEQEKGSLQESDGTTLESLQRLLSDQSGWKHEISVLIPSCS